MATLRIVGSSSRGNAYILDCGDEQLIIELGCGWNDILSNIKYDLSNVRGCLVSHRHKDHSKSIPNALKYGLSVYSCKDVQSIHSEVKVLKKGVKTRIGGFLIQPIPLKHNVECIGFVIDNPATNRIVFATDCESFPYKIKGVSHFLIEANNDESLIIDHLCDGYNSRSMSGNHLEINDTIDALKRNYSPALQTVVLCHLSDGNSNAEDFKQRVQTELGFPNVYVAESGMIIELNKEEF